MKRVMGCVLLATVVLLAGVGQAAPPPRLGPVVRLQTPGRSGCHAESETAVAVTSAGTWVAYNDLGACQAADMVLGEHVTYLQLLPAGGGSARVITLPALEQGWGYLGDPSLAVDTDGAGVVLASLAGNSTPSVSLRQVSSGSLRLEVVRVSARGVGVRLPAASRPEPFDDKEAVAVDRAPGSPRRGWVYLAWDEGSATQVSLRAFDGHRWRPVEQVNASSAGRPDVAVGPRGEVAVAFETVDGVAVRVAAGGRPLGRAVLAIRGSDPGHVETGCPLINAIGVRQRVIRSPRLAWDGAGRLHLVAAVNPDLRLTPTAAGGPESSVVHAVSHDAGRSWSGRGITEGTSWAPSIAALPDGGVAIGYLSLADPVGRTFTAHVWRTTGGTVQVSEGAAALSEGSEAARSNYCYGMGDYTGLAARGADVVYAWASTAGAALPASDTDVLVRRVLG